MGRILGNPNEKVDRWTKNQIQLPRGGMGSMECLTNKEGDEDAAKMEQLIREAVKPRGRIARPQKESDNPFKRGN